MKSWRVIFLTVLIIVLGFPNPHSVLDAVVTVALGLYITVVVFSSKRFKFNSIWFVIPIIILFLISSIINGRQVRAYLIREPVAETYRTDMDDFLKTYYLMKNGRDYYSAFKQAVIQNAFKTTVSNNLWSWRLPTIFYIWQLFPSAIFLYAGFLLLCSFALLTSLFIGQELLPSKYNYLGILAPYLLYSYLHFAARDSTLLQTEWWGMFCLLFGMFFWFKKNFSLAVLFITLTVLVRELFIVPLLIMTIIAFKQKQNWRALAVPGIILVLFMLLHFFWVARQIPITPSLFVLRTHTFNKQIILPTLAFASWEYIWNRLRIFIIFFGLGLVGILFKRKQAGWLWLSFFIFPLSFLFIGSSVYNDYWGILYMPFVILAVPSFVGIFA